MTTPLSTQPYKGTRDFYPDDMRVRNWMFSRLRKTLKSFGYEEYDGPMLEPLDLYRAKTSDEIVNEQLYWLKDRGERELAIRPEMTPTLARMVAGRANELARPIRWFSLPNLWRYERPQRGRLREHWQLNVDVFGGDPLAEDLEICQVVCALMEGFGAKEGFEVRLNHRGLTNSIFQGFAKIPEEKLQVAGRLLDAAPKMGVGPFKEALKKEDLSDHAILALTSLLESEEQRPRALKDHLSNDPHYAYVKNLTDQLKALGVGKYFRYDPSIMRGFMYYTGMVLEVYDTHPENNRALFGGGRYDNLVGMFSGKPLPGVGFGMGDVTLRQFLETHGLLPNLKSPHGIFVAHLGEAELIAAQTLARELRQFFENHSLEIPVLTSLSPEKPRKVFSSAEKLAARAVVFVGPDDVRAGRCPMKDLIHGDQVQGGRQEQA
ncbi:MAG: histidine--tRNA ligase, partial [Bdellovibrionota bacterium]